MKLDAEFLNKVSGAIYSTWGEISPDAECSKNVEAIELVLDADRMSTAGHKSEDDLIGEAIAQHGWTKVSRFLSRNIRLL